jgi:hypothetical protein
VDESSRTPPNGKTGDIYRAALETSTRIRTTLHGAGLL